MAPNESELGVALLGLADMRTVTTQDGQKAAALQLDCSESSGGCGGFVEFVPVDCGW